VKPTQAQNTSAAIASKPAPAAQPNYVLPQQAANRAPAAGPRPVNQPTNQYAARPNTNHQVSQSSDDPIDNVWQTMTVAFQGEAPKTQKKKPTVASEDLPMPEGNFKQPVMRHPTGPDAWNQPMGGPYYQPYGNPDPFCDDGGCPSGCGDGCGPGCGCACEPGCGCEPGCACEGDCCNDDVFCIGPGDDESCHTVRIRWPKWQEVVVFGGAQGFKGPYDQERDSGNFGFNEGFNIGAKIPYAQIGYQFGWRGVQSQLNGDKDTGIEEQHFQTFATAGLFHRQCEGLQFGVVWDMLNDERWHARHFHQIRTELGVVNGCHEIGFDTTIGGLNSQKIDDDDELVFQASDQFLLYYRIHGPNGGEGRIFAGGNDDADGIVGSDVLLPVGGRFSIAANFTYLIPHQENGEDGATQEAWNIGVGLVWHWDGQARKCFDNCYRPMFNVADNGTLIVDQRPQED
jgi:Family of unknown function (DUF6666)